MTRITTVLAVCAVLVAGRAFAQTPPPTQTTPPPTQTTPPPTQTTPPAAQKPTAPATPAPVPFPADAKVAFIDLQRIVGESRLGKEGSDRMKVLTDKLSGSLASKNKEIQSLQEKMKQQQGIVSDAVMAGLTKDLDRMQREAQFMQQDAQVQIDQLNEELLKSFQDKVLPVVEEVRKERGLWIVFALGDNSNIAAAHAGLDLSLEIVKRLDTVK